MKTPVKNWGVYVEVTKRGKLQAVWWARYVDEAGARASYARKALQRHRVALVVMVVPQPPVHRCAFTWCPCIERVDTFNNVPSLEISGEGAE